MKLSSSELMSVLQIGIELTTQKNKNKLFASILENAMKITRCDAATLYIYENDALRFGIMKTKSLGISRGDHGDVIDLPPVPLREESVCAYSAIHREVVNIPDVYHSDRFDFSGPKKYDAITGYHTQSQLVIPLENNEQALIGVLQLINAQDENGAVVPFDADFEIIIRSLGSMTAIEMTNLAYIEGIKNLMTSFVQAFAKAVDERTPYNGNHTRKVAEYAVLLGAEVEAHHLSGETDWSFDKHALEKLKLAALLHDIGKIAVPLSVMDRETRLADEEERIRNRFTRMGDSLEIDCLSGKITAEQKDALAAQLQEDLAFILSCNTAGFLSDEVIARVDELSKKTFTLWNGEVLPYLTEKETEYLHIRKGTLTDSDRRIMENHVVVTRRILDNVAFTGNYENVPVWAAAHHEYLNGTGYPDHLTEEQLGPEIRILTVVDIYDALTATDRPYKKPMPPARALSILRSIASEGKIDGVLVEWFAQALAKTGVTVE